MQETRFQANAPAAKQRAGRRRARFWRDLTFVFLRHPLRTAALLLGRGLPADFRERIMLAVTEVNGCGACAWIHAREALRAGVLQEEIEALLGAGTDALPESQLTAILYARHWADTQGDTHPEAAAAFENAYNPQERERIELAIRFINTMNHVMLALERRFAWLLPRKRSARAR